MKYTTKQRKLSVSVEWDGYGESPLDKKDQSLYEMSALDYIERFNSLPPIGLHLANGYSDAGKITQVNYDGCNDRVWIWIEF